MDLLLLFTMIVASTVFVGFVMVLTRWISPRTFNRQKGETYECGIPTQGNTWIHFKAGYYLFAILFLMFDIEAVFLFPWATIVKAFEHRCHLVGYCAGAHYKVGLAGRIACDLETEAGEVVARRTYRHKLYSAAACGKGE